MITFVSTGEAGSSSWLVDDASDAPTHSFDTFYNHHRNEIGSALSFALGSQTLGQEAVDEAMVKAYKRWHEVGAYENPAGWVYRAGLRWGLSWIRSRKRRQLREELVATTELEEEQTPSRVFVDLTEALAQLSPDHRSVVVLRYLSEWSVKETADALDLAEGTVKSRLARALNELRGILNVEINPEIGGDA